MTRKRVLSVLLIAVLLLSLLLTAFVLSNAGDLSKKEQLVTLFAYCVLPVILIGGILCCSFFPETLKRTGYNFRKYIPLVRNLVSKDLKVKYRRSVLGYLWSVLNPLLMALVISIVFSGIFRNDQPYFATYYLLGSLIFSFVVDCTSNGLMSIIWAAPLIKKVYIPKYIFPLQKCVFSFVNMLFGSVAVIVVMIIQKVPFQPASLLFFFPMLYAFVFAFGFSLILSSLTVFFRDTQHLYGVFTQIWMYLTPLFYSEKLLSEHGLGFVLTLNPMYCFIKMLRTLVLEGTLPPLSDHIMALTYALVMLVAGLFVFRKTQDKFILNL